jgi:magnesium transporter
MMQIVEFRPGTLRFAQEIPESVCEGGFVWIYLERESLDASLPTLQQAAQRLGGSAILDLHVQDMRNAAHPSHYDYTSVYDRIVFRRLATQAESAAQPGHEQDPFRRISTLAVSFIVFDRLLISVHPGGCFTAKSFIQRYLADAVNSEGLSAAARSRLPAGPSDLMLRMVNLMVDSYLDLRKQLSAQLDHWQQELLRPRSRVANWNELMAVRAGLHALEDLCEEQQDAMQEWLDTLREQPPANLEVQERDNLVTRARDVVEHVQRVMHHVRRLEQGAETAVQIHFSVQGNRTNDIMRTLTALTAIFLPLNLIAGIFGMNFEFLPLIHVREGFWWAMGSMLFIAVALIIVFSRKHYLARSSR